MSDALDLCRRDVVLLQIVGQHQDHFFFSARLKNPASGMPTTIGIPVTNFSPQDSASLKPSFVGIREGTVHSTAGIDIFALLPDLVGHVANRFPNSIHPFDSGDALYPCVTSGCSHFQDTFSPTCSSDPPPNSLALDQCIGFVVLA